MSDAQSIALSGLKTEEFHINKLAQDLSNLNTHNYKTSELTFSDLLYQDVHGNKSLDAQPLFKSGLGAVVLKSGKNFAQGPLIASQNWNHIAIDGPGFFQVQGLDNQILYTRNSSLILDAEHYLATDNGLRLTDNIQIPEDALNIFIRKNGDVEAILPEQNEPQLLGNIQLAKFVNPESLNTTGSGFYIPAETTGEPVLDTPGSNGMGELMQHHIEGSNVDMLATLMQLTMAQRVYQLNAKAMQIADEMEKMTNEIRS